MQFVPKHVAEEMAKRNPIQKGGESNHTTTITVKANFVDNSKLSRDQMDILKRMALSSKRGL